ncbi:MAG: energy transducer TonB [Candidatus Omnitrophica bacterium]|nr:energy transducer TonB [Candidatus Omnitrophota bacterium]
MFTNPVFRTAFAVSLLAHMALVAPHSFLSFKKDVKPSCEQVELNYIIIRSPDLALEEEVYVSGPPIKKKGKNEEVHSSQFTVYRKESELTAQHPAPSTQHEETSPEKSEKYSEEDKKQALLSYYNIIREKIRAQLHFNASGYKLSDITLLFILSPDGNLKRLESAGSDADPQAKRRVLRAVRGAQPFPEFPAELGTSPIKFSLTVQFAE